MSATHKQCPRCKQITTIDAQICIRCNHRFRTKFVTEPPEQTVALDAIPKCSNCGAEVQVGAKFCSRCGFNVSGASQRTTMPEVQKVQLDLGAVRDYQSYLHFFLEVEKNGAGFVFLVAGNSDRRRREHMLYLNLTQYEELKQLIARTDKAIAELKASGRLKK